MIQRLPEGSGAGDRVLASTTADAEGSYRVAQRPGTYVVAADAGLSCSRTSVRVAFGASAKRDIACDAGIR